MRRSKMLIAGKWTESEQQFESTNPSTGEIFGLVDVAQKEHIQAAIAAARNVLPEWKRIGVEHRTKILNQVVERLRSEYGRQGEPTPLKQLISQEMGKRLPEADIEVIESSDMLNFFVKEGPSLLATRELKLDLTLWSTKRSYVNFEPVGVIGVIKPWNYPLELPIWAIGPALIAGNTVLFKPSEHSSFVGVELGKFIEEAGVPQGVINVLPGGDETGELIVQAEGIDMITFTGSVATGRKVAIECSRRLKRYTLELGGNDAAIITPDVDMELAANGIVWGSFANSGQVCVRPKRVFIHRSIARSLISMILEKTTKLRPGIDYGPLISQKQLELVEHQVEGSLSHGAKLIVGGQRLKEHRGFYFEPTILIDVPSSAPVMQDECFGPVLPIVVVDNIEEGIQLANSTKYGLGASIWTGDLKIGEQLASELEAGMVWVNDVNVAFPQAPWGGTKESGYGVELGEWGLYEYTVKKHINVETSNSITREWWFPY